MKQNGLFTVQCPSADMRGHSEMHLERSMGLGLNEQHAMVCECKIVYPTGGGEAKILRAAVKIVTQEQAVGMHSEVQRLHLTRQLWKSEHRV